MLDEINMLLVYEHTCCKYSNVHVLIELYFGTVCFVLSDCDRMKSVDCYGFVVGCVSVVGYSFNWIQSSSFYFDCSCSHFCFGCFSCSIIVLLLLVVFNIMTIIIAKLVKSWVRVFLIFLSSSVNLQVSCWTLVRALVSSSIPDKTLEELPRSSSNALSSSSG